MSQADDLQERLVNFAVRAILLCDKLPRSYGSAHIAGQLARSGTAPPAHYAEARGAESDNDFVHKLKLCIKELNESQVWLKIIIGAKLIPQNDVPVLLAECVELSKIINVTISSVKRRINDKQKRSKQIANSKQQITNNNGHLLPPIPNRYNLRLASRTPMACGLRHLC